MLEARLCGSLPLARAAGQAVNRGELMRYLAELIWGAARNLAQSAAVVDATTLKYSTNRKQFAQMRLIFDNSNMSSATAAA